MKLSVIFKRPVSTYSSKLLSDPFKIDNTRRMRDTKSRFPKPNFVSFDAFGTIYVPKEPIFVQYHKIASEFGILKSPEAIKEVFPKVRTEMLERYPNYGKHSETIKSVDEWWSELIVRVFGIDHYSKNETSLAVCNKLIDHFASSKGYKLFDDVIPTFTKLQQHNIPIIISSNSDIRIIDILESLGLGQFIDHENIFISYSLDSEKPTRPFFDSVLRAQSSKSPVDDKSEYLSGVWHIGDGHDEDFLGAVKAGWNGVFLDRPATSKYLSGPILDPQAGSPSSAIDPDNAPISDKPMQLIADNRAVLSDLRQLIDLFKLD